MFEAAEKRVNKQYGTISYWKDGVLIGKRCTKCGVWKLLEEYYKDKRNKDGKRAQCKECMKQHNKQWREKNPEYDKQYHKDNAKHYKEYHKQYYQDNVERIKEQQKQYYQDNTEHLKKQSKQYHKDNAKHYKEYGKQYRDDIKENNLQYISSIVNQAISIFRELNLPAYGYIYKFENVKSGRVYIGQTIRPLKLRYSLKGGIIKSWIKDRKKIKKQKFLKELIEEDFKVTEVLDVGFCEYHLNALESYYINKYDSYNNGYNNTAGNHITDDGFKEFMEILQQHNLEFINGQIVKKGESEEEKR